MDLLLMASFVAAFLLSIVALLRKLHPLLRVFPLGWQIVFVMSFLTYTHGFPSEMFKGFMFAIFWSFFALISSWRLYGYPMPAMKILAFCQFMEAVCILCLSALSYISACWRFYGRIVWNP